jgi:dTDP-D-glucose 4,6-dehydratase
MELIVRMYHSTYWGAVPAIGLTRCANVFGFGDTSPRRVIPLFVTSAMDEKSIPLKYRLNGRQFIYVTERNRWILQGGFEPERIRQHQTQGSQPIYADVSLFH